MRGGSREASQKERTQRPYHQKPEKIDNDLLNKPNMADSGIVADSFDSSGSSSRSERSPSPKSYRRQKKKQEGIQS